MFIMILPFIVNSQDENNTKLKHLYFKPTLSFVVADRGNNSKALSLDISYNNNYFFSEIGIFKRLQTYRYPLNDLFDFKYEFYFQKISIGINPFFYIGFFQQNKIFFYPCISLVRKIKGKDTTIFPGYGMNFFYKNIGLHLLFTQEPYSGSVYPTNALMVGLSYKISLGFKTKEK